MSLRLILVTAVLVSLPLSVSAQTRSLASGILDARFNYDFACSVVNKSETEAISVAVILKDEGGMIARNPFTQAQAILTPTLPPGEAATLEVPAGFAGLTSLYCWAEVPVEASAFGTFMVRDAGDNSTASIPLKEDTALVARSVLEEFDAVHIKIEDSIDEIDDSIDMANPARSAFQADRIVTLDPGVGGVLAAPLADLPAGERLTVEFVSMQCSADSTNPVISVARLAPGADTSS